VSRDFLTGRKANVGELAHVVSDSPDFARGDSIRSVELAKEGKNLILACFDCHGRIDRYGKKNEHSEAELLEMKREHEQRIELIYSATGVKLSLPILMSFPVAPHPPAVTIEDVHHALLKNTSYTRFPSGRYVNINRADFDVLDGSPDFWPRAEAALEDLYERRVRPELTDKRAPSHLTIAAFAPIPLLMKLGALIGDKIDASVLDLPLEQWLWDTLSDCPTPSFRFEVPQSLPREVNVLVSISNVAVRPTSDLPAIEFRAELPNRGIIRTDAHLQYFRREFNAFLMRILQAGAQVIHIHPVTPLCASVEVGRMLLPKTFEEVHVWEYRASTWFQTLRLR
jgi:hypothetical protein